LPLPPSCQQGPRAAVYILQSRGLDVSRSRGELSCELNYRQVQPRIFRVIRQPSIFSVLWIRCRLLVPFRTTYLSSALTYVHGPRDWLSHGHFPSSVQYGGREIPSTCKSNTLPLFTVRRTNNKRSSGFGTAFFVVSISFLLTLAFCQYLMAIYLFLSDRHGTNSGARWSINGVAVKLAQSVSYY